MARSIAVTEQCPMEIGLNVLSGKWKLKILWQISKGAVRYEIISFSCKFYSKSGSDPACSTCNQNSVHFAFSFALG